MFVTKIVEIATLMMCDLDCEEASECAIGARALPEDLTEAKRFRTATLQRRFLAKRYCTRAMISLISGCDVGEVTLLRSEGKKPRLITPKIDDFEFSVSCSDQFFVGAVSTRPIGVDVEKLIDLQDWHITATTMFTEREIAHCQSKGEGAATEFLRYWTAKEAILKAMGVGLAGWSENLFCIQPEDENRFRVVLNCSPRSPQGLSGICLLNGMEPGFTWSVATLK